MNSLGAKTSTDLEGSRGVSDDVWVRKPVQLFNLGRPRSDNGVVNFPDIGKRRGLNPAGLVVTAYVAIDINYRIDEGGALAQPPEDLHLRRSTSNARQGPFPKSGGSALGERSLESSGRRPGYSRKLQKDLGTYTEETVVNIYPPLLPPIGPVPIRGSAGGEGP